MKGFRITCELLMLVFVGAIAFQLTWGQQFPVLHRRTSACDSFTVRKLFFSQVLRSADLDSVAVEVRAVSSDSALTAILSARSNLDPIETKWFNSDAEPGKCQAELKLQRPNKDGNSRSYIDYTVQSYVPSGSSRFESESVLYSVNASLIGMQWFK